MNKMVLWVCLMLSGASMCFAEEGPVEVTSVSIAPHAQEGKDENGNMYLSIGLKNDDLRTVKNVNLEISYYTKDEILIQKSVVKKALVESIPPKEERKYEIHLNRYNKNFFGSLDTKSQGQYPYDREKDVDGVRIKVTNVRLRWQ